MRLEARDGGIDLGHDDFGTLKQELPGIGQVKLSAPTLEQRLADGLLKLGDLLREGGLGLVQQLGRARQRARVRHGKKDAQLVKREGGTRRNAGRHQTAFQSDADIAAAAPKRRWWSDDRAAVRVDLAADRDFHNLR
ncbi:MAG TPA: hypothetical protein VIJ55_02605 [Acetobacteraceae bacterium]